MDRCLIIAEAGVNHNGDVELAYRLCDAAKKAGADVVKFQTWKTEALLTANVEQADYQKGNTGTEESQFDMLKKLELSYEDFRKIKKYCESIGILFASTADERESLDFLLSIGIPFIKVGSGEINNIPYLRYIGSKRKPVILSTGMSSLGDVERSVRALKDGGAEDITLLHCTTNYPAPLESVNLRAMPVMGEAFGLPYGYSDHTVGTTVAVAAVALGACVIEKHFTLDRNMEGPDHKASMEPDAFGMLVKDIRNTELLLGDAVKKPTPQEKRISSVVKKRIVAATTIPRGTVISETMITAKRNNRGTEVKYWDQVVGSTAIKSYRPDDPIEGITD